MSADITEHDGSVWFLSFFFTVCMALFIYTVAFFDFFVLFCFVITVCLVLFSPGLDSRISLVYHTHWTAFHRFLCMGTDFIAQVIFASYT